MCEVAWRQLETLGFPGGSPELEFRKAQRQVILELLTDCRQLARTPAPNVHFGSLEAGRPCRLHPPRSTRQGS